MAGFIIAAFLLVWVAMQGVSEARHARITRDRRPR